MGVELVEMGGMPDDLFNAMANSASGWACSKEKPPEILLANPYFRRFYDPLKEYYDKQDKIIRPVVEKKSKLENNFFDFNE
jgi:hypothetical protein